MAGVNLLGDILDHDGSAHLLDEGDIPPDHPEVVEDVADIPPRYPGVEVVLDMNVIHHPVEGLLPHHRRLDVEDRNRAANHVHHGIVVSVADQDPRSVIRP